MNNDDYNIYVSIHKMIQETHTQHCLTSNAPNAGPQKPHSHRIPFPFLWRRLFWITQNNATWFQFHYNTNQTQKRHALQLVGRARTRQRTKAREWLQKAVTKHVLMRAVLRFTFCICHFPSIIIRCLSFCWSEDTHTIPRSVWLL